MIRKIIFILFIFILIAQMPSFAGDTYEQTVHRKIYASGVLFYGTVDMSTDSIGNFYTNAMFIGNCNSNNAFIWAVTSEPGYGTEDVDVYAQYAQEPDGTYILSSINSGKVLDAVATTTKTDTLNVYNATSCNRFPGARWLSLKFDGQTGNTHCTVSWYVFLKFDSSITSSWRGYWSEATIAPIMKRTD